MKYIKSIIIVHVFPNNVTRRALVHCESKLKNNGNINDVIRSLRTTNCFLFILRASEYMEHV